MKYLLAPESRAALRQFARAGTLLALDYDGTLAPIVADRTRARMRDSTQRLLARITRRYPTVFISGRARLDVLRLLEGIGPLEVIGNHGLETDGAAAARYVRRVRDWHTELEERLETLEGVAIEDKKYSLAVHYRASADKPAARDTILRTAESFESVRIIGGADVINLVPAEAPNKGDALLAARARWNCERAIFVGDDDTDEDVFRLEDPGLLTARIGVSEKSAARYFLRDQTEIDALLGLLLDPGGAEAFATPPQTER